MIRKLLGIFGLIKDVRVMPQSRENTERRELTDRLIQEHRIANAQARSVLQKQAPAVASRYVRAMDDAMAIIKGEQG